MYSRFLEEAGRAEAPLAADAAERWTELAEAFQAASEAEEAEPKLWAEIDARARSVSHAEDTLWAALSTS
jgi:hypothetical protein